MREESDTPSDPRGERVGMIESLLQRHLPELNAYIRLRAGPFVRSQENPSDLVQSVCREVLEDLDDFRYAGEAAFKQWLYKRALHKIVDRDRHYRAAKRGGGRPARSPDRSELDKRISEYYFTLCTPSRIAMGDEAVKRIEAAFDRIPDESRELIIDCRILGMTPAEVAEKTGRKPGAVRTQLCRALARLATLLDESPPV